MVSVIVILTISSCHVDGNNANVKSKIGDYRSAKSCYLRSAGFLGPAAGSTVANMAMAIMTIAVSLWTNSIPLNSL